MNIVSKKLNKAAEDRKIGYHHGCKMSKLTYLCFANDIHILSDGSLTSIQGIITVLRKFQVMSKGPLINYIGHHGPHQTGIPLSAMLASLWVSW